MNNLQVSSVKVLSNLHNWTNTSIKMLSSKSCKLITFILQGEYKKGTPNVCSYNNFHIENLKNNLNNCGLRKQKLEYFSSSKFHHSFFSSWTCYSGFNQISLIFTTKVGIISTNRRGAFDHPVYASYILQYLIVYTCTSESCLH